MDFSEYLNLFSISKTLRFKLIPQGNTLNNLAASHILEEDQKRAIEYGDVKTYIDRYHKDYIERKLTSFAFPDVTLEHSAECYWKNNSDELDEAQNAMMQAISNHLRGVVKGKNSDEYEALFSADLIKTTLPNFLDDEEELSKVKNFAQFSTYFSGFFQNRRNLYTGDGKSTEIAYRIVKQNFPKFLDNIKVWQKIIDSVPSSVIEETDKEIAEIIGMTGAEIFTVGSFNHFLSQSGIDKFNWYIGGYSNEDGSKIQGLNEKINLLSQQIKGKLPKLKPLFKQILSDRDSISFIPEMFDSDQAVLTAVAKFKYKNSESMEKLHDLVYSIGNYDLGCIYVPGDALSELSNILYGSWSVIKTGLESNWEREHPAPSGKITEKYENAKKSFLSNKKSWSLSYVQSVVTKENPEKSFAEVIEILKEYENGLYKAIYDSYSAAHELLESDYPSDKKLAKSDDDIALLKNYLDSIKDYQHFIGLLAGNGNEPDKDSAFYGVFEEPYDILCSINHLYDKVRNYVTKKPYSTEKIRMMFNRSDFLGGWAQKDEWGKQEAHLFVKDGHYYIFVTSKTLKKDEWETPINSKDKYTPAEHLEYFFQKPDNKNTPRLFIRSKGDNYAPAVEKYKLPIENVIDIYDNGYFKTEYRSKNPEKYRSALKQMIEYYKLGFTRHEAYSSFDFRWKDTDKYTDISEFYRDTINSCYSIRRSTINFCGLMQMVDNGLGYLFEIYSKDFSPYSHGTPNLHTIYFKALFDETNAGRIRLQGGAQIYYRAPSLKLSDTTVHPANVPLKNKNPNNPKTESTFAYDLIKNKRFIYDHFQLHIPVSLNATVSEYHNLNSMVRSSLAESDEQYIIGIDRGERNLLYISVIDSHANIVEQFSMNVIDNTDYHDLLDEKENERMISRKEWKTIAGIKETKEGYLSQAVHRICLLLEKYHAIIVMENLNSGFKDSRSAVEKSVYQKFEKMLCDKLSYMTNKQKRSNESGGILSAYQLATPTTSYSDMQGQNGIIFYVDPWLTSKIDPTTGFVDLLHPKYETIDKSKEFLKQLDSIAYHCDEDLFAFSVDLSKFPKTQSMLKKEWEIFTNGSRIRTFRNSDKNNQWDMEEFCLTDKIKKLCNDYGIDYTSGNDLKEAFYNQTEKAFFESLIYWLRMTLQMRNSKTGTSIDYMISPVKNDSGTFYDSRNCGDKLPKDADANGAYNIARKGLMIVERLRGSQDPAKEKITITREQWLKYAQENPCKGE